MKKLLAPVVMLVLTSCAADGPRYSHVAFASASGVEDVLAAARPTPTKDGRVVLITLDGVRAADVFDGADPSLKPGAKVAQYKNPEALMPRTYALVKARGVALGADRPGCGTVRTASGANVSLPGYLEIFTGRKTLCRDNACAATDQTTVLDEAVDAGLYPVASIGSWQVLDHAVSSGKTNVLVAEGSRRWPGARPVMGGHLEELVVAGERSEAYPGHAGYRPDAYTAAIALEYLRTQVPAMLHVGLGDTDEYAHQNQYAAYLDSLAKADAFIGKVADTLDTMGDIGKRTTVIVTTDHGRNADFQHHGWASAAAARTWVVAFGGRVAPQGVACPKRDVTLADIAPTVRELVGLPRDMHVEAGTPIEEVVGPDKVERVAGAARVTGGRAER